MQKIKHCISLSLCFAIATTLFSTTLQEDNAAQAISQYTAALAIEPHNFMTRFMLANVYAHQENFSAAYQQFKIILDSRPDIPTVLYNAAYCLRSSGNYEQAVVYYTRALELDPTYGDARQGRAHAQLALGTYADAWPDFEYRWTQPRPDSKKFADFMHNNIPLHGKRLLLRAEFGLGDTLQFVRYAQELKKRGAFIIVQAQRPLIPLLSLCPYIDQLIPTDQLLPTHDLSTVLMSLPWAFNTTLKTIPLNIPYLYADQSLTAQWQAKLSGDKKVKIGLCWNGNAYDTTDLQRLVHAKSIPLAFFAQLNNPHISWYSLQKVSGTTQLENLPTDFIVHSFDHFDESHGRFMDTAALMKNLDLVITIDTSIAHLAGGLGVPTWTLLPYVADWRWDLKTSKSHWYKTMRLFRQQTPGDWQSVIDEVKKELDQLLLSKHATLSIEQLYQQGVHYTQQGNLNCALAYFQHAYDRIPGNSTLAHALGSTHRKLNNLDQAAIFYRQALQQNPTSGDSIFGLALTLLAQGNNQEGWELFNRWRSEQVLAQCPQTLEQVSGKTVVILAEWGLGDMIHFIRYARALKKAGAYVILQAHSSLVNLLTSCDGIDEIFPAPAAPAHADYYIPLLYLPTLCKTTNETIPADIPYIQASDLKEPWLSTITKDKNFKIGVCWNIGHHDTNIPAWQRSAPLQEWVKLATLANISLYSLQKDGTGDIQKLTDQLSIIDLGPEFDTRNGAFVDSAALMKHMDLVITVDTAIAHLAGALGINTWVLLPYSPDYRWGLNSERTKWYSTMRLFRQKSAGDWASVFQEVETVLKMLMHR